jgi:hypothetical protein
MDNICMNIKLRPNDVHQKRKDWRIFRNANPFGTNQVVPVVTGLLGISIRNPLERLVQHRHNRPKLHIRSRC